MPTFLDFETYSESDLEISGGARYSEHPSTDIVLIGYALDNEEVISCEPHQDDLLEPFFDRIIAGDEIVAHNYLFELFIWLNVGIKKYDWPKIRPNQWRDTMHMCGKASIPLALSKAAKALKLDHSKLDTGKGLMKIFSMPQKDGRRIFLHERPKEAELYKDYNRGDVFVSRDIWNTLPKFSKAELNEILFDYEQNRHGIPVNKKLAKSIYQNVIKLKAEFENRVSQLTKGRITTLNQVKRIKEFVNENSGLTIPNLTIDTVNKILEPEFEKHLDPISKEILEMRVHAGKSSVAKYARIVDGANADNRICGHSLFHGARTGRPVGRQIQVLNLPKPSIKYESMDALIEDLETLSVEEIDEKYGSYMKSVSSAIRGMIQAPPGKILVGADYASIEARGVMWFAHCMQGLKLYYENKDPYVTMASIIYNVPEEQLLEDLHSNNKHVKEIADAKRFVGKQSILGSGYGMSWRKFMMTCESYGQTVEESLAKRTIYAYRETFSQVPELWKELDESSLEAVRCGKTIWCAKSRIAFKTYKAGNGMIFLLMRLPNGRYMMYPDIKLQKTSTPWGQKRWSITYKVQEDGQWRRTSTYGGKLLENATQGMCRDAMLLGAHNVDKAGYEVLFTVYDEIISMIDKDKANVSQYEQLLCNVTANPDGVWARGFPLKAEGKTFRSYRKL